MFLLRALFVAFFAFCVCASSNVQAQYFIKRDNSQTTQPQTPPQPSQNIKPRTTQPRFQQPRTTIPSKQTTIQSSSNFKRSRPPPEILYPCTDQQMLTVQAFNDMSKAMTQFDNPVDAKGDDKELVKRYNQMMEKLNKNPSAMKKFSKILVDCTLLSQARNP